MKRLAAVPSGQDVPAARKEHPWTDAGRYGQPRPSRIAHDEVELRHLWALEAFKESESASMDDLIIEGTDSEPPSGYAVEKYPQATVDGFDAMCSAWASKK